MEVCMRLYYQEKIITLSPSSQSSPLKGEEHRDCPRAF